MAHLALSHSGKAMNDKMNSRMVKLFMVIGLVWLVNACGVAEGLAFLRIEGRVVDQNGYPVVGKEIQLRLQPEDLDRTPKPSEGNSPAQTKIDGRFSVEKSRFAGGLFIIPMALAVMPISGLVAAVTPWTFKEVYHFFSPAYLVGSHCLPHPMEIAVVIGVDGPPHTFSKDLIEDKLYRGKEFSKGRPPCTLLYDLGELKILSSELGVK
ncbi:MAG: hypothetical protein KF693_12820 [Nitrospira sp.]|nr:hypothetical protein [Nitrospira sp.]